MFKKVMAVACLLLLAFVCVYDVSVAVVEPPKSRLELIGERVGEVGMGEVELPEGGDSGKWLELVDGKVDGKGERDEELGMRIRDEEGEGKGESPETGGAAAGAGIFGLVVAAGLLWRKRKSIKKIPQIVYKNVKKTLYYFVNRLKEVPRVVTETKYVYVSRTITEHNPLYNQDKYNRALMAVQVYEKEKNRIIADEQFKINWETRNFRAERRVALARAQGLQRWNRDGWIDPMKKRKYEYYMKIAKINEEREIGVKERIRRKYSLRQNKINSKIMGAEKGAVRYAPTRKRDVKVKEKHIITSTIMQKVVEKVKVAKDVVVRIPEVMTQEPQLEMFVPVITEKEEEKEVWIEEKIKKQVPVTEEEVVNEQRNLKQEMHTVPYMEARASNAKKKLASWKSRLKSDWAKRTVANRKCAKKQVRIWQEKYDYYSNFGNRFRDFPVMVKVRKMVTRVKEVVETVVKKVKKIVKVPVVMYEKRRNGERAVGSGSFADSGRVVGSEEGGGEYAGMRECGSAECGNGETGSISGIVSTSVAPEVVDYEKKVKEAWGKYVGAMNKFFEAKRDGAHWRECRRLKEEAERLLGVHDGIVENRYGSQSAQRDYEDTEERWDEKVVGERESGIRDEEGARVGVVEIKKDGEEVYYEEETRYREKVVKEEVVIGWHYEMVEVPGVKKVFVYDEGKVQTALKEYNKKKRQYDYAVRMYKKKGGEQYKKLIETREREASYLLKQYERLKNTEYEMINYVKQERIQVPDTEIIEKKVKVPYTVKVKKTRSGAGKKSGDNLVASVAFVSGGAGQKKKKEELNSWPYKKAFVLPEPVDLSNEIAILPIIGSNIITESIEQGLEKVIEGSADYERIVGQTKKLINLVIPEGRKLRGRPMKLLRKVTEDSLTKRLGSMGFNMAKDMKLGGIVNLVNEGLTNFIWTDEEDFQLQVADFIGGMTDETAKVLLSALGVHGLVLLGVNPAGLIALGSFIGISIVLDLLDQQFGIKDMMKKNMRELMPVMKDVLEMPENNYEIPANIFNPKFRSEPVRI